MKKFLILFFLVFQFSCSISDPEMMELLREINTQNKELLEEVKSLKIVSDSLINEIKGNSGKQEDLLKIVSSLQTDISKIIQEISKLNEDLKKQGVDIDLLKSQIADLQKKYEQIIVQLEDLKELSKILGEIEKIKIQLIDLNKKYESVITSINQNKDQIEQLKSKIESVQKQLDENLLKISQLTAKLSESDANVEDILDQIGDLQDNVNQLLLDFQELLGIKPETEGNIAVLDCVNIIKLGNLVVGQGVENVTVTVNYEGGNGKKYESQIVTSTGVLGLSATLSASNFEIGNGTINYSISGTPNSSGTAKFLISVGGKTCEISIFVASENTNISGLNCNTAVNTGATGQELNKLVRGYAIPGANSTINYFGGDGSNHTGQIVNSTGVTGLTATLLPGKFNFGSGNLSYSISGTPSSSGTASFELSIGGQTCILSWDVNDNQASRYPNGTVFCEYPTEVIEVVSLKTGRIWMDRNLGGRREMISATDVYSHGDLYQWGRRADGHQCRNSKTIGGPYDVDQPETNLFIQPSPIWVYEWRQPANDNLWQGVNGINNPCPSGYRIPTDAEWAAELKGVDSNTIGFLAMQTNLKFSAGGLKNTRGEIILKSLDDSFSFRGGLYWSSGDPVKLNINSNITTSITIAEGRASGLSVRCIKN
jgi:predicted  nucleic acid-binding Zn-ribbon protein